ncbi:MAG: MarR family winged helix-turn-helix transcriptional regulator [Lautropia sp.]
MSRAGNGTAASGPTFVDEYLAALLTQASHLISHEFHETVRAQGFTVLQWRVLATLADGQTMSVGEVAERTVTTQPTVSRVVDELRDLGMITRMPHPGDRRISQLKLTPAGRKIAARLVMMAREHEDAVLAAVGDPVGRTLKRALQQLIELRRRRDDGPDAGRAGSR